MTTSSPVRFLCILEISFTPCRVPAKRGNLFDQPALVLLCTAPRVEGTIKERGRSGIVVAHIVARPARARVNCTRTPPGENYPICGSEVMSPLLPSPPCDPLHLLTDVGPDQHQRCSTGSI